MLRMKTGKKKGFTLVEIMLVISIIGLLATLGIPSVLRAYARAQTVAINNNIASVEKAKGILTLPRNLGMAGAIGLTVEDDFDEEVISNLCAALRIESLDELTVGGLTIEVGTLTLKAYYD
jgi:prepilin-type N-terminal cleavage/methylation domain-containing protein